MYFIRNMINEVFVIMQICDSVDNNVGCLSLQHCNKYHQTCQWYLIFLNIDTFDVRWIKYQCLLFNLVNHLKLFTYMHIKFLFSRLALQSHNDVLFFKSYFSSFIWISRNILSCVTFKCKKSQEFFEALSSRQ